MKNIIVKYVDDSTPLYSTRFTVLVEKDDSTREQVPFELRTYFRVKHIVGCACLCDVCSLDSRSNIIGLVAQPPVKDEVCEEQVVEPDLNSMAEQILEEYRWVCGCEPKSVYTCQSCSCLPIKQCSERIEKGDFSTVHTLYFSDDFQARNV